MRSTDPTPEAARATARAAIPSATFRGRAAADAVHDAAVISACTHYDTRAVRLWGPK